MSSYYIEIEHLPAFQELHKGIPRSTITTFFGPPQAGKSTIAGQLGIEVALKEQGDLLVFDTENSFHTYDAWLDAWSTKFDVDINLVLMRPRIKSNNTKTKRTFDVDWEIEDGHEPDKEALNVYILHCPDIQDILIAHGRGMEMKISENASSGKMMAIAQNDAWARDIMEAPFAKFIKNANAKCVIYDSLTNPLDEFVATSPNFPARADMTQAWLIQVHKMLTALRIPALVVAHESRNDSGLFSKELKVQGGKSVLYNTKFVNYVLVKNDKGLLPTGTDKPRKLASDERALYAARHVARKAWAGPIYLTLSDNGITEEEN